MSQIETIVLGVNRADFLPESFEILIIPNIESFYCYRSTGIDFKLVTPIFSDQDKCITLSSKCEKPIRNEMLISEEAVNQDDTEDYNNIKDKTFRTLNDKHQRIKLALEKIEEEHKKQAVLQQFQNQPVRGLLENIPMTSYQASINNNIPKPPPTLECPEFCRKHGIFSYSNFY